MSVVVECMAIEMSYTRFACARHDLYAFRLIVISIDIFCCEMLSNQFFPIKSSHDLISFVNSEPVRVYIGGSSVGKIAFGLPHDFS